MGWRVFLMRVGSSGWNWFVNVWNHVGAITGTLALVGGLVLSFALRWWIVLVVLAVLVVVIGFVGSFRVWEDAELRAGAGRASFPDLVVTAEDALWLDPEESRDFPGEYESLVCVRVRVTNREPDRKANLRFTLHAGVKRPFEHKMELRRAIRVEDKLGLEEPVKVSPQDTTSRDLYFMWSHSLDFVFGEDPKPIEVIREIRQDLLLTASDNLSEQTVSLAVPGRWPDSDRHE
jgi:hypothetical protein